MRTTILIVALGLVAVIIPASAGELEPPGAPAPTMNTLAEIHSAIQTGTGSGLQFLGTTPAVSPAIGVLSLTAQCQQTFGSGTRMCTSVEILNSVNVPEAAEWNTPTGWLRPVYLFASEETLGWYYDATGLKSAPTEFTCGFWTNSSNLQGLAVQNLGGGVVGHFLRLECSEVATGVACCGPVSP